MNPVKIWLILRTYAAYLAAMEAVAWDKGAHTWQVFALVAAAAVAGPLLTALDPWDKSYGIVWESLILKLLRLAGMSSMLDALTASAPAPAAPAPAPESVTPAAPPAQTFVVPDLGGQRVDGGPNILTPPAPVPVTPAPPAQF